MFETLTTLLAALFLGAGLVFMLAARLVGPARAGAWAGRLVRGAAKLPLGRATLRFTRRHRKGLTAAGVLLALVLLPFLLATAVAVLALVVVALVLAYSGALEGLGETVPRIAEDGWPEGDDIIGWRDADGHYCVTREQAMTSGHAYPIRSIGL